jgi:hypothetical protein
MIYWKHEGKEVRNGISVYHPKDKHSIGIMLRIGNHLWRIRYSKLTKLWHRGYHKTDPKAYEDLLKGPK